jgi:hypothetical protein
MNCCRCGRLLRNHCHFDVVALDAYLLLMERAHAEGHFNDAMFKNAKTAIPERLRASWRGDAVTTEFLKEQVGNGDTRMVPLMELAEGLAALLTKSSAVNANPRLMKRFLNTVYLRAALAEPQGINLDIPALAKWHLIERCNEGLANAIGALVTSASDGRVEELRAAEEAVFVSGKELPAPFKDDSFIREWLQLHPALGETDLRPLLHLSRDTATRDFGADNMTTMGRTLRDALAGATSSNIELTKAITEAGSIQAQMAMERAWQLKASKRGWRSGEEMVPLIEPCKVFSELTAKAATLLAEAPLDKVGPGIIPPLYTQAWARPIIDKWEVSQLVETRTKTAIQRAKKAT